MACDPGLGHNAQDELHEGESLFGVAMQEAIVSDAAKASGEDVLQYQP